MPSGASNSCQKLENAFAATLVCPIHLILKCFLCVIVPIAKDQLVARWPLLLSFQRRPFMQRERLGVMSAKPRLLGLFAQIAVLNFSVELPVHPGSLLLKLEYWMNNPTWSRNLFVGQKANPTGLRWYRQKFVLKKIQVR